jgi:hypothetical protein
MTMALPNRLAMATTTVYAFASIDLDCRSYCDRSHEHRIRRHGRRLEFIAVMTRRGYACWMQEIPFLVKEMFRRVGSARRGVRRQQPRQINLVELARPPPELPVASQSTGYSRRATKTQAGVVFGVWAGKVSRRRC